MRGRGFWLVLGVGVAGAPQPTVAQEISLPEIVVETSGSTTQRVMNVWDARQAELFSPAAASVQRLDSAAIAKMPQGADQPFDRLVTQFAGVSSDSAASRPDFHIRNEYSNAQYRINGVMLPDGVSGLGAFLETSFIGSIALLDGVLPAQYGLRTAGVFDIRSKTFDAPGGTAEIYGGSHGLLTGSMNYGGTVEDTQYFISLRGLRTDVGIENPTSSFEPIHDRSTQFKGFGYISKIMSDSARLTAMAGGASDLSQIPNVPGQAPLFPTAGRQESASLDDREADRFGFGLLALQTHDGALDTQVSLFSRYANVHYMPDVSGEIAFTGVASDVTRDSVLSGANGDFAYRASDRQTLRGGWLAHAETTRNTEVSTGFPVTARGTPILTPTTITDIRAKLGTTLGAYLEDEIQLTPSLTLRAGARFDQMFQYVSANQFSPRVSLTYAPDPDTKVHAGYARYFTPPGQAEAATSQLPLYARTTLAPDIDLADAARPERAHYFDVGIDRSFGSKLDLGADAYLKLVRDYLDDGDFGNALIISQVNYAKGYSEGVELKSRYHDGGFSAYGNVLFSRAKVTQPISNQYVFDADEYAYLSSGGYMYADDAQSITASAGLSYNWLGWTGAADGLFGSGLRSGFVNSTHVPAYTRFNLSLGHDLPWAPMQKPMRVRFDVVNVFDTIYQLRDGSGIGVEAPQYGPRRGFYLSLSQTL